MNRNDKIGFGILVGGIALAIGLSMKGETAQGGIYTPKFHVGNHIISKSRLPTDIIYVIISITGSTYGLAQWFQGQAINPSYGISAEVVDANYVLV